MRLVVVLAGIFLFVEAALFIPGSLAGSEVPQTSSYTLLSPIRSGNLTVFPVTSKAYDTAEFLTLDEGLRSGEVVVTEAGQLHFDPSPPRCT